MVMMGCCCSVGIHVCHGGYLLFSSLHTLSFPRAKSSTLLRWRRQLSPGGSRGPHPLADLGRVLEMFPGVGLGSGDQDLKLGDQGRGAVVRPTVRTNAPEGLHRQVVAAHAVEDDHVEWGRGGALLGESPHVETVDIDVSVHDLVDRPPVAVEGEDDLLVCCKQLDEARLAHPVRMELPGEEGHQIHDVDYPHLEFGCMLAQPARRSDGLQGRDVPCTAENDVGLLPFRYVGRPIPDGGAAHEVLDGSRHAEPLELGLLVYGYEVHVVAASETVVGAGEEGVSVGRQVDSCDGASLGEHDVYQAWPLVGEAVVVVAPSGRCEEDVERSDELERGED